MKPTARQRVLAFIRRQPGATAAEIGRALKMSPPTVRHHLSILRLDGRIEAAGARKAPGRGRPMIVYKLSDRLLGDNLAVIADTLLDVTGGSPVAAADAGPVRALANGLLGQLGPPRERLPITVRLNELVHALDQIHYAARWEAGAEGPRVVFGHCPYAAIIERHPELCQMDRLALSEHMQADALQVAKIDRRSQDPTQCVFVLRQRRNAGRSTGAPSEKG